ncbi:MAG: hypothetical protein ACR2PL_07685 [Dehalococcoidia bacterium]
MWNIEDVYTRQIRPLTPETRLRLLELIAHDLAGAEHQDAAPGRSLLELEGLGSGIWEGIDAQAYVNELRTEWDSDQA